MTQEDEWSDEQLDKLAKFVHEKRLKHEREGGKGDSGELSPEQFDKLAKFLHEKRLQRETDKKE